MLGDPISPHHFPRYQRYDRGHGCPVLTGFGLCAGGSEIDDSSSTWALAGHRGSYACAVSCYTHLGIHFNLKQCQLKVCVDRRFEKCTSLCLCEVQFYQVT